MLSEDDDYTQWLGPEGEEHWSIAEYKTIEPKKFFEGLDAFCDADGKINEDFPRTIWLVKFSPKGEHSFVDIENEHQSLEDLEKTIRNGL